MVNVIFLTGPTAVGKTEYVLDIAESIDGEIISCDSMQIYKYFDIGSAKPTEEQLARVKHYLVGQVDPRDEFSVAMYSQMARAYIDEIMDRGKIPIVSGGTGLYLNSLIYQMDFGPKEEDQEYRKKLYDIAHESGESALFSILKEKSPETAERLHPKNIRRVVRALEIIDMTGKPPTSFSNVTEEVTDYVPILLGLSRDRKQLYDRINMRVDKLMDLGLLDEVKGLMQMGLTQENIAMKGIGYKEILDHINGMYTLEEAVYNVKRNTRRYAKRQMTWFRRYKTMKWFDVGEGRYEENLEEILTYLKGRFSIDTVE